MSDVIIGIQNLVDKQIKYASMIALNETAKEVKKELVKKMVTSFDRPTPITLNSIYIKFATRNYLAAEVKIKDFAGKGTPASKYLKAEVFGGERREKKSEVLLRQKGILPVGMVWIPGSSAKKNHYGNISGGQITQILSVLKAHTETGFLANTTAQSRRRNKKLPEYFAISESYKHLKPGVYQRINRETIKLILEFRDKPSYKVRFDFYYIAYLKAELELSKQFDRAIQIAMNTAR